MSPAADLGRRIEERRNALKLSRAQLAERAGMDQRYLQTVEESSSPHPSRSTLWRLAAALGTTMDALTGADLQAPPGRGPAATDSSLEEIDTAECLALVGSGGIGRVVFAADQGPVAEPVNFAMLDGSVVWRTPTSSPLASPEPPEPVSFEVDHIDDALSEGWSVLFTGTAGVVSEPEERHRVEALHIEPWAGGDRPLYLRLVPTTVTGRRIRRG